MMFEQAGNNAAYGVVPKIGRYITNADLVVGVFSSRQTGSTSGMSAFVYAMAQANCWPGACVTMMES